MGFLTAKQLRYAQRVQSKLATPKALLRVLQDLRYVSRDQIQQALRANKIENPLGDLLLELGVIRASELESALAFQKARAGAKLGEILIERRFLEEKTLIQVFSLDLGYPRFCPAVESLETELLSRAPARWYLENDFMPLNRRDGAVVLAFADPLNQKQLAAARKLFGENLLVGIAPRGGNY